MKTMTMIGAGAVGQTLAHLWVKHQLVEIVGVLTQSQASADAAIAFIGQGQAYSRIEDLPHADITLIATPDDNIQSIAKALAVDAHLTLNDVVFHCSGALSSDCLRDLSSRGIWVASVHPMMSFKQPNININLYKDIPCALEGDSEALAILAPLFEAIGSWTYSLQKEQKALYHAAAVFASNYQVTLAEQAMHCMRAAGLQEAEAQRVVIRLMQTTLGQLAHSANPKDALTGPLQRGDTATIQRHLDVLSDPILNVLYRQLGLATLPMTELDDNRRQQIIGILASQ